MISANTGPIDTIYRLKDVGPDSAWHRLEQKLAIKRGGHVAFWIPDSLTNCTLTGIEVLYSQFHQHLMSSFCVGILSPKNAKPNCN